MDALTSTEAVYSITDGSVIITRFDVMKSEVIESKKVTGLTPFQVEQVVALTMWWGKSIREVIDAVLKEFPNG